MATNIRAHTHTHTRTHKFQRFQDSGLIQPPPVDGVTAGEMPWLMWAEFNDVFTELDFFHFNLDLTASAAAAPASLDELISVVQVWKRRQWRRKRAVLCFSGTLFFFFFVFVCLFVRFFLPSFRILLLFYGDRGLTCSPFSPLSPPFPRRRCRAKWRRLRARRPSPSRSPV